MIQGRFPEFDYPVRLESHKSGLLLPVGRPDAKIAGVYEAIPFGASFTGYEVRAIMHDSNEYNDPVAVYLSKFTHRIKLVEQISDPAFYGILNRLISQSFVDRDFSNPEIPEPVYSRRSSRDNLDMAAAAGLILHPIVAPPLSEAE